MTEAMKVDLPVTKALRLLREVVEAKGPEHVYRKPDSIYRMGTPECMYAHGSRPGCLVGQVLYKAGVPVKALAAFDKADTTAIRELVSDGLLVLPAKTLDVLSAAQAAQDIGETWGEALRAARDARRP